MWNKEINEMNLSEVAIVSWCPIIPYFLSCALNGHTYK